MQITGHSPPVGIFQDPFFDDWECESREKFGMQNGKRKGETEKNPIQKTVFLVRCVVWVWPAINKFTTSKGWGGVQPKLRYTSGFFWWPAHVNLPLKIQSWNLDGCGSHSSHPWQDERWYYHMNLLSGCTGVCVWVCVVNFHLYINQWKIWMCTVGLYTCHLDDVCVRLGI